MYKITKRFENFDGVEISEDFFFNMTEEELVSKTSKDYGDFLTILKRIVREKDGIKLIELFREIVLMSFGIKSADGKHFYKDDTIRHDFECHAAFSSIYMDIASDDKLAAEFIKGVMPKKYASQIDTNMSQEQILDMLEKQ